MTSTNETLDMAKNSLRKRFNSNSLQQLLTFRYMDCAPHRIFHRRSALHAHGAIS